MKIICIISLACLTLAASAQVTISGRITEPDGTPMSFANVYVEGSYDGTISDSTGHFEMQTDRTGKQLLVASSIGFEKHTQEITLSSENITLAITMEELVSELNEVAITAGVFSASDKKKSATLNSFDIATTASAMGDIYGTYATMPGSQKVGEEGLLFVRGGEGYETRTYMDGMLVQTPYFSSMPYIPTRGRFSPLLFSETLFSTGGYSAEFGHGLSSIVDLTTNGLETEDKASVSIMSVGANASFSKRWENTSLAMTGLYANNAVMHRLFKQNVEWIRDPVLGDGMVMFRRRVGETGLLKVFSSYNFNTMQMNYDNFEAGTLDPLRMKNHTWYVNTSYSGELNDRWLIRTGGAYSRDDEDLTVAQLPVRTNHSAGSLKLVLTHLTSEKVKIRMGGDVIQEWYLQTVTTDSIIRMELVDIQPSLFVESEIKLTNNIALRMGARGEYSSLLEELALMPRISAAYKTGKYSQVSLAYGKYRQKPEHDYLRFAPGLMAEKADHYILNFQYRKNRKIFRIESYMKQYRDLVKYHDLYSPDASNYNNDGYGYAGGVDLFWRDSETIQGADYWISYSYLKTSRDYRDFPHSAVPRFASTHNLSLVYKQFITPINTFAGITYSFASARPYDNKNSGEFMAGRTRPYNDISLNLTFLTQLFGNQCVIHLTVNNVLGFNNIFGYRFADITGEDGLYASQAIVPTSRRQAVLLLLLSL